MHAALAETFSTVPRESGSQYICSVTRGGLPLIDAIAEEWRLLCAEGPCAQPFYLPEWISCYLRQFAVDVSLLLLTVRNQGRLRAVLPLVEEQSIFCGFAVTKLKSPTNVHSCRFDVIHGTGDRDQAVAALWNRIEMLGGWDLIELADVPKGGAAEGLLANAQNDGCSVGMWKSFDTPIIHFDLTKKSAEQCLTPIHAGYRSKLRKKLRKLQSRSVLEFRSIKSLNHDLVERFYDIEANGWKGREGTAIRMNPAECRFYDDVAQNAAAHGYFGMDTLVCDGREIAINFSLPYATGHFVPKTTYDERYGEFSPGQLLFLFLFEELFKRHVPYFDFLGPTAPWKERFASEMLTHSNCYIFKQGGFGNVLYSLKFGVLSRARRLKRRLQGRGLAPGEGSLH